MTQADPTAAAATPAVAVIFDIDGVVINSPHERAWREALAGFTDPTRFTSAFYQAYVAGKPRLDGARAALTTLGVADTPEAYAVRKQARMEQLIEAGKFTAFADAVRLLRALRGAGVPIAAASSSKNANHMLEQIPVPPYGTLRSIFTANLCGRDEPRGKPARRYFWPPRRRWRCRRPPVSCWKTRRQAFSPRGPVGWRRSALHGTMMQWDCAPPELTGWYGASMTSRSQPCSRCPQAGSRVDVAGA